MLPSRIELNRRKDAEGVRDGWKKLLFCSPVSRTLSDVSHTQNANELLPPYFCSVGLNPFKGLKDRKFAV